MQGGKVPGVAATGKFGAGSPLRGVTANYAFCVMPIFVASKSRGGLRHTIHGRALGGGIYKDFKVAIKSFAL